MFSQAETKILKARICRILCEYIFDYRKMRQSQRTAEAVAHINIFWFISWAQGQCDGHFCRQKRTACGCRAIETRVKIFQDKDLQIFYEFRNRCWCYDSVSQIFYTACLLRKSKYNTDVIIQQCRMTFFSCGQLTQKADLLLLFIVDCRILNETGLRSSAHL